MEGKNIKLFDILCPIFILVFAFFIRFHNIDLLPINHDEANSARFLLGDHETIRKSFIKSINHSPLDIFPFLSRITDIKRSSFNEFMLRIRGPALITGTVTVLLLYILTKQMYGRKTAIISSFLLCFLPWHIIQSRVALSVSSVPFFGCLIFLSLFKAIQSKNRIWMGLWFLFACFFLRESLRAYESAILFIPIFLISLIYLSKEIGSLKNTKIILFAILIIILFFLPIFYNIITKGQYLYRFYQRNIFEGPLHLNLLRNFKNNIGIVFHQLFFASQASSLLYGQALKAPLLVHPILFILFIGSLALAAYQRKTADKILLIWLFLGFLGASTGVDFFQARYILIALPPLLILISRFIAWIFTKILLLRRSLWRTIFLIVSTIFFLGLITTETIQWAHYYYDAPFDSLECLHNSYGCKESAEYLSQLPDVGKYKITFDFRMTTDVYLNYYLLNKSKIDKYYNFTRKLDKSKKGEIYVLWAFESHPKDYWSGLFYNKYAFFRQKYPNEKPIKTIYYPDGLAAIRIFKIQN